ncbi:MAG: RsmG family class I SAM-dependent methyltransferase [Candidatus Hydrogenedentota bacterium]
MKNMLDLLHKNGVPLDSDSVFDAAEQFIALIQEWNKYASLVSVGDAASSLPDHCIDSWTLLPWIASRAATRDLQYVDIGSGGGFPAIPICVALPELKTILIERNTKKAVFLRKVTARLNLENVQIQNDSFDGLPEFAGGTIVTSRAIEKPLEVIPRILSSLGADDHYLCQSESIHEALSLSDNDFVVTELQDVYSGSNRRRNRLYIVQRSVPA